MHEHILSMIVGYSIAIVLGISLGLIMVKFLILRGASLVENLFPARIEVPTEI